MLSKLDAFVQTCARRMRFPNSHRNHKVGFLSFFCDTSRRVERIRLSSHPMDPHLWVCLASLLHDERLQKWWQIHEWVDYFHWSFAQLTVFSFFFLGQESVVSLVRCGVDFRRELELLSSKHFFDPNCALTSSLKNKLL